MTRLAAWLAPWLVRALAKSWRIEWRGREDYSELRRRGPVILVLWHGRMLMGAATHRGHGYSVLVSPSGDGEIAVRVLARLDFRAFRGSASRGGARALRELAGEVVAGRSVGLTPDGPRGPRHAFNAGAAWLARATGAPIVAVAFATDRARRLRSWDRFTIPKFRARVRVEYLAPVRVPPTASDAELERCSASLRDRLIAVERGAFAALGVADDHPTDAAICPPETLERARPGEKDESLRSSG
ncbi:MAG: lysophospholipid acyltransferase family protein [Planctomycetota bacterium]